MAQSSNRQNKRSGSVNELWRKRLWLKLDDYQREAVNLAARQKTVGLFFEAGSGKTHIAAGLIEKLNGGPTGPQIDSLCVVPLSNIDTTWHKLLSQYFCVSRSLQEYQSCQSPQVLLLHYEAVSPLIKQLRKIDWKLIVYDEAHRLKDRNSLQSRTAAKLRYSAEYKLILSGTPIERQPQDLWAQFRFLVPGLLGDKWRDFEREYLEELPNLTEGLRPRSYRWHIALRKLSIIRHKGKFRPDKLEQFLSAIKPYAQSLKAGDVLDLPSLSLIRVPVKLRGKQRLTYETLEKEAVIEIKKRRITAPLKISQMVKLQQICGGYVITDEGDLVEVGRAKLRAILSIVKAERKPIVIFCRYLEELRSIGQCLRSYNVDYLIGKTKDRGEVQQRFQSGGTDILLAQIRTGGVGIDLFAACVGVLYSTTFSLIDFDQAIKRLHRRGQTRPVKVFLPYVVETIDEDIYEAYMSKRKLSDLILARLRKPA